MTDRLSRFTPNGAGLDRDAILFAAGRRSARSSRLWPLVAGMLAATQALTLVMLWPAPAQVVSVPVDGHRPVEWTVPPASSPADMWSAGSRPEVIDSPPSSSSVEYVSEPTLTARSHFRFD
jgi:hypothetical protein